MSKTSIVLSAINELKYNRFEVYKVLVIAPKKVAEATWQDEAEKWDHTKHLKFSTVLGSQTKRVRAVNTPADIYIVNRDNVKWLVDYYRNDWPFDMVVIDEASSFKSNKAQRWKSLKSIREHIKRIVELTGTPAPHSLLDLWPQVYLLDEGQRLGKTIGGFRERYFNPDKRDATRVFTYKPKDGAEDSVKSLLSDICISMKAEDYLDLPPQIDDMIPVVLDTTAQKAYDKLEKEMLLEDDDSTIDAGTAAVLTNKLLQMANGAIYDEFGIAREIHTAKLEALEEDVEAANGEPVLVAYAYKHDLARIKERLKGYKLRTLDSEQDIKDWNAGKVQVLLLHPNSGGHGLNLQAGGHNIIWFGLTWSLEFFQQTNARLDRQGQTERVRVRYLIAKGTMDEKVLKALTGKAATQNNLMEAVKARIKQYEEVLK